MGAVKNSKVMSDRVSQNSQLWNWGGSLGIKPMCENMKVTSKGWGRGWDIKATVSEWGREHVRKHQSHCK